LITTALIFIRRAPPNVSEKQGEAEHDLYWLGEKDVVEGFFHECHKWAANQIRD
jgi:hypothetical protein